MLNFKIPSFSGGDFFYFFPQIYADFLFNYTFQLNTQICVHLRALNLRKSAGDSFLSFPKIYANFPTDLINIGKAEKKIEL